MTPAKTSRGRPKGTGLNDTAHLRAIAGLLADQPDLKPTTAIRKLGIDDPSIIRRLRDKYQASEAELIRELKSGAQAELDALSTAAASRLQAAEANGARDVPAVSGPATVPTDISARAVPLAGVRPVRKSEPVAALEPVSAVVTTAKVAAPALLAEIPITAPVVARRQPAFTRPSDTALPSWMGVGLSLFVFSFEAQYAIIGTLMQSSPFAQVMKSQSKFLEAAIAATIPRAG